MKRVMLVGAAAVVGVCLIAWYWLPSRGRANPRFDTPYQAVLLDNNQAYYGKVASLTDDFLVLDDVYYVDHQVDAQSKAVKNVLIRRGNEWHAPNRTFLNRRHVIMIEPVTPSSKVAELIAAFKQ